MKDESLLSLPCSCKLYVRTKFRYATSSGAAANMLQPPGPLPPHTSLTRSATCTVLRIGQNTEYVWSIWLWAHALCISASE